MRKFVLFFLCISFNAVSYNQVVKGTVLDGDTQIAIDYALIYFSGTFIGTYSDQNGNFELDISNYGSAPLTISAIGYYSMTVTDFSSGTNLKVLLKPKITELDAVVINAKSLARERKANLRIFKSIFIGTTENAPDCKINNEWDITFNYGSDKDTLKAFALKPMLIENMALGYRIIFYLDKFEYCRKTKCFYYEGNINFKADLSSEEAQKILFERRRKYAYLGSRMHFFRALWANNLDSNGFVVRNRLQESLDYKNIVFEADNHKKYLNYKENLNIVYNTRTPTLNLYLLPESNIVFRKQPAYFDRTGYFDPIAVNFEGDMATRGIADWLPYEYSIK